MKIQELIFLGILLSFFSCRSDNDACTEAFLNAGFPKLIESHGVDSLVWVSEEYMKEDGKFYSISDPADSSLLGSIEISPRLISGAIFSENIILMYSWDSKIFARNDSIFRLRKKHNPYGLLGVQVGNMRTCEIYNFSHVGNSTCLINNILLSGSGMLMDYYKETPFDTANLNDKYHYFVAESIVPNYSWKEDLNQQRLFRKVDSMYFSGPCIPCKEYTILNYDCEELRIKRFPEFPQDYGIKGF